MTSSHIVVEHIDINESPIDIVKGKNLVNISVIRFTFDDFIDSLAYHCMKITLFSNR